MVGDAPNALPRPLLHGRVSENFPGRRGQPCAVRVRGKAVPTSWPKTKSYLKRSKPSRNLTRTMESPDDVRHTRAHAHTNTPIRVQCSQLRLHRWVGIHIYSCACAHTPCAQTPSMAHLLPDRAPVADARDSMSAADVEGIEGPGLRNVDDAWVLLPEYRVVPQPGDPQRHQQESEGEGVEEEEAVAVQEEALAFLVQDEGQHGEEGEDEEDEDLALGDQVPEETSEVRRVL